VETHPIWVQEVPGSIPGKDNDFFEFLFCCCVFTFFVKTHYLSQKFAIAFTVLIYLVYLTYFKICSRL